MYVISLSSSRDRRSLIQISQQHIMYVISLSSSRDRRSLIQSLIAAHYVCNKFI